ncbi:beta-ketoacyl reductase [Streptomyces sparsogenes]|uniref:beta-ketoacyl reductase n=1 Tax=Streptomyces sparsogenes TaxID=67365 RepID=UPI003F4CE147
MAGLSGLTGVRPRIPVYGPRREGPVGEEIATAGYWLEYLRQPSAAECAVPAGGVLLDLSPLPRPAPADAAAAAGPAVLPLLDARHREDRALLGALARLHTGGTTVAWTALFGDGAACRAVPLPTYAFQRRRYWLRADATDTPDAPEVPAAPDTWVADGSGADGSGADGSAESAPVGAADRQDPAVPADPAGPGADQEALDAVLAALAARRGAGRPAYRLLWRPLTEVTAPRLRGTWLLVTGRAEADPAVSAALRAHGADVVVLGLPAGGANAPGAGSGKALARRIDEAAAGRPLAGVLSTLAADLPPQAPDTGPSAALAPTAALVEAVALLGNSGDAVPVWVATRRAVGVDRWDAVARPDLAQVWAVGGALAAEYRDCWGGLVDLPDVLDTRAGRRLAAVVGGAYGESEAAVRADGSFVRRLAAEHGPGSGDADHGGGWTPRGTTLITRAGSEPAAHLARRLAGRGAERLLLAGAPARELVAELAARGTRVSVTDADLTDPGALASLVAGLPPEHPLTAAVLLAPALDPAPGRVDPERIAREWPHAVAQASAVCALAAEHPLSVLVVCSSVAGVLPGPGQGNQAPAHAHLHALAQQQRARGLPVTAVLTGPQRREQHQGGS